MPSTCMLGFVRNRASSRRQIDLIEVGTIREVILLRLRPAAEISNGKQLQLGKLIRVLGRDFLIDRTIVIARDDLLRFRAVQVLKIFSCDVASSSTQNHFVYDRNGWFGENALGWHDHLNLIAADL